MGEEKAKKKKKVNKNVSSKVISDLSAPSNGSVTSLFFFPIKPHQRHRRLKKTRQGLKAENSWKEVSAWSLCSQCQRYEDYFFYLEDIRLLETRV